MDKGEEKENEKTTLQSPEGVVLADEDVGKGENMMEEGMRRGA